MRNFRKISPGIDSIVMVMTWLMERKEGIENMSRLYVYISHNTVTTCFVSFQRVSILGKNT